ncbi:sucrose-6f-phosphate phosphohydrolase [Cystoisospora suis]|uniref:Sucrose-6f-phosphate phosphohydrolase n=1 Tax=Cystoisospora suis TaxID=483139 RepID=A0A2C6KVB0_9APIC|nr:sucrose-6f-phosphate phosphohydrolase [Cystoisospora suis]
MTTRALVLSLSGTSPESPVLFQFYYQTGWRPAILHCQQHLSSGQGLGWQDITMESCSQVKGVEEDWQACELVLHPSVARLEFVCCNLDHTQWDNPAWGTADPNEATYVLTNRDAPYVPNWMLAFLYASLHLKSSLGSTNNYMVHFSEADATSGIVCPPDLMPLGLRRPQGGEHLSRHVHSSLVKGSGCSETNREKLRRVVCVLTSGELAALHEPPCLLVTDLDGTLLGHDHYLWLFKRHWALRHRWRGSQLVYNTGRNLKDFLNAAGDNKLPRPAYAILGVGTEIYFFPGVASSHPDAAASIALDPEEREQFREAAEYVGSNWPSWCSRREYAHFSEEWIERVAGQFRRKDIEKAVKASMPGCYVNGNGFYDPFRISVSVPVTLIDEALHAPCHPRGTFNRSDGTREGDASLSSAAEATLTTAADFLHSIIESKSKKICVSGGGDWRYLDILPKNGGKLNASLFVMEKLGFQPTNTIVAGDSGNDIEMFCEPSINGVCVSNAQAELRDFLQRSPARQGENKGEQGSSPERMATDPHAHHGRITFEEEADDGIQPAHLRKLKPTTNVCFATHDCAGGILDGLLYFKFDTQIPPL